MFNAFYSVTLPDTAPSKDETLVHRYPTAVAGLTLCAPPNITTVFGAFKYRLSLDPDRQTMGQRPVLRAGDHERKLKPILGPYEWLTYRQINEIVLELGAGLSKLLKPSEPSRVVIYAPTSQQWTLCMLACYSQGMQVVTAYDTLGDDGLVHAMNETRAQIIFAKADQLPTLQRVSSRIASVHTIVYYSDAYGMPAAAQDALQSIGRAAMAMDMDSVRRLGREWPRDASPALSGSETALVMYTSGSTGAPRGVLVAHGGILAVCGAIEELVPDVIDRAADRVLSYLPLSHVLAFFVETFCLYSGLAIGYGTPRTLSDDNVDGGLGDLRALRPAVMLGVPQVWAAMRANILRQVAQRPAAIQWLFHAAVEAKTWLSAWRLPTGLLDAVVFRRTRAATGGCLKIAITGGAQISAPVQKFIAAAICPMIHGYGLTEASGLVSVQIPGDLSLGNVGAPMPSVEVKLVDVPEAGYFAANQQGEILVRGPSVFQGYLDNEALTRDTVTEDGWLRTGDVGQWVAGGRLAVIDRIRNLIKLATGEFVALEALESAYAASAYVAHMCVIADARMRRPCALVSLAEPLGGGVTADMVFADLLSAGRAAGLPPPHLLAHIRIDPEPWTPENGLLTAANKLRRAAIRRRNESQLLDMFELMERRGERLAE
ncbi:long-chain fatty acid-CoA ligase [Coemansia spiralis]|uniref:Long-chain fatty acid-CoA ligase n=1 Tax=Coemansia spiralis TaxID=417178 RepID=A0A9W8GHZ6_9FUNG|nr:long-chain fatty acid-CoA ligase [Coemansia spiralis]